MSKTKTRILNIKPQEVTENGERSVRYRGTDGKMHTLADGDNNEPTTELSVVNVNKHYSQVNHADYNDDVDAFLEAFSDVSEFANFSIDTMNNEDPLIQNRVFFGNGIPEGFPYEFYLESDYIHFQQYSPQKKISKIERSAIKKDSDALKKFIEDAINGYCISLMTPRK